MANESSEDILSNAIARAFLDASVDAVCIRDKERRLLLWNASFSTVVRETCGTEVAVGMRMEDYVPMDQFLQLRSAPQIAFQTLFDGPQQMTREFPCIDGKSRWFDIRWVPIKVNEVVIAVAEICRDVTADRVARIDAQKKAELLREHLKLERDPVFCYEVIPPMPLSLPIKEQLEYLSTHGVLIEANQAYADIFGIDSVQSVLGRTWGDVVSKSIEQGEEYLALIAENQYNLSDLKLQPYPPTDGVIPTYLHQIKSLQKDGNLFRVWGASRDITEKEHARIALRDAEEKYRLLVESAQEAITVIQDGRRVFYNRRTMELTGYTAEELNRYSMFKCVHPDDLKMVSERYSSRLKAGKEGSPSRYEMRLITKTGQTKWVFVTTLAFAWEGRPALLIMLLDITERTLAQEEVRRQQDALARMGRTAGLEQMAGSITHELNQPLTGIISNSQAGAMLLKRGNGSNELMQDILKDVISDAKRASEVIRSMRGMYRSQKDEFKSLQLNELIQGTIEMLRSEFIARGIRVTFDLDRGLPLVMGNQVQLQQVLINLISNANEAMSDLAGVPLILNVSTVSNDGMVYFFITDSGPGIQPDEVEMIFEPYATWKPGGTGLGLSICNSIIRVHGGEMSAENVKKGGARVGFSIPINERDDI